MRDGAVTGRHYIISISTYLNDLLECCVTQPSVMNPLRAISMNRAELLKELQEAILMVVYGAIIHVLYRTLIQGASKLDTLQNGRRLRTGTPERW